MTLRFPTISAKMPLVNSKKVNDILERKNSVVQMFQDSLVALYVHINLCIYYSVCVSKVSLNNLFLIHPMLT